MSNKLLLKLFFAAVFALILGIGAAFGYSFFSKNQTPFDKAFNIKIGETAVLGKDDFEIKFVSVAEDSRCPAKVQCIWAGQIKIKLHAKKGSKDLGDFELVKGVSGNEDSSKRPMEGFLITLVDVAPYPQEGPVELAEYVAKIIVSK
ncbi:MAG: hypothetical protein HYV77_02235 [Candidatus Wildermuthbacteria bacterium]|nr:hypothetical protein [Candidatus Wildermuthbacteria bacterium]